MSWGEIKKAVNSDISTPLNTLITNLISQVKSYISTAGNVKVIRNVQRGFVALTGTSYEYGESDTYGNTVSLSGFTDTSKMLVVLNGGCITYSATSNGSSICSSFVKSLSTTSMVIRITNGDSSSSASGNSPIVSYEVIEFY